MEAEEARPHLDARFVKLRSITSEMRGRDMGMENSGSAKYLHLEQNMTEGSISNEKLLEAVPEAGILYL